MIYALLAAAAGALLAVQAAGNARLREALGSSALAAATVSVIGTTVILLGLALASGAARRGIVQVGQGPWWAYLGGVCGVVFLVVSLLAVGRQGVALTFVAVVAGQLVAAMLIDRFGLLGVEGIGFTWYRVAAAGLMVAALVMLLLERRAL